MKRLPILAALAVVFLLHPWQASAQPWSPQQQEVWAAVQAQWHAAMAPDTRSSQRFLYSDSCGPTGGVQVMCEDESAGWAGYESDSVSALVHALVPIEIVFHGDTARVSYHSYSPTRMDPARNHPILLGRYTDVLVKENNRWGFRAGTEEALHAVP
jgi:hypothetical protein